MDFQAEIEDDMRLCAQAKTVELRDAKCCFTTFPCSCLRGEGGFTLTELVIIIVILGIISAVAAPRFFDRSTFDSRGFHDQTLAALRYAQKSAIAQHRTVCVTFTAGSVALTIDNTVPADGACDVALTGPTGDPYTVNAPSGISLSGYADFSFNAFGAPSMAAKQSITVSGQAIPIAIEAGTGYVH